MHLSCKSSGVWVFTLFWVWSKIGTSSQILTFDFLKDVIFMVVVRRMQGDSDDSLIRKFSRKVLNEGILQEAKRREFYLKPSLARKQKIEDSRRAKKFSHSY